MYTIGCYLDLCKSNTINRQYQKFIIITHFLFVIYTGNVQQHRTKSRYIGLYNIPLAQRNESRCQMLPRRIFANKFFK